MLIYSLANILVTFVIGVEKDLEMDRLYLAAGEYFMIDHVKIHDRIGMVYDFVAEHHPVPFVYRNTYKIL